MAFPGKDFIANSAPIGKPNMDAIRREDILTFIDNQTISNKDGSSHIISLKAVEKASKYTSIMNS